MSFGGLPSAALPSAAPLDAALLNAATRSPGDRRSKQKNGSSPSATAGPSSPAAYGRTVSPQPVTTSAIERSNVDPNLSLVELVEQSRAFEMQTKLIAAAREMDEGTASLMRVQ
jgi:flagellar basal body rod protein FlgG